MAGVIELAREYAVKNVSLATSMYNPQAETIAAYSFIDGYKAAVEKLKRCTNCKYACLVNGCLCYGNKNMKSDTNGFTYCDKWEAAE